MRHLTHVVSERKRVVNATGVLVAHWFSCKCGATGKRRRNKEAAARDGRIHETIHNRKDQP